MLKQKAIVNYCTPAFQVKNGQFPLSNEWQVYSLSTPDTVLYVPCESYPLGAYLIIEENSLVGNTSVNGFWYEMIIKSSDEIQLKDGVLGLMVGTRAEHRFEDYFLKLLAPNTTLSYGIQNNVLTVQNPLNSYSIKLYVL